MRGRGQRLKAFFKRELWVKMFHFRKQRNAETLSFKNWPKLTQNWGTVFIIVRPLRTFIGKIREDS